MDDLTKELWQRATERVVHQPEPVDNLPSLLVTEPPRPVAEQDRLAGVSGFAEAGSDARACVCPWPGGNLQRAPICVGKRLRACFRQARPAGDLHRGGYDCERR